MNWSYQSAQERVTDELRRQILGGRWQAGQKLPPERTLSSDLGVSRLTLRGGLATLASEGLVRSRQGSGIEVLDVRQTGSIDLVTWLLAQDGADGQRTFELFAEVVRLRRLVALDTMIRAAGQAGPDDLAALAAIAAAQATRTADPDAYLEGDRAYQRRLIRTARSTVVELLFNTFERVLDHHRDLTLVFMGPLELHCRQYEQVQTLLGHPEPEQFRSLATAALDLVEVEGLARVREHCLGGAA